MALHGEVNLLALQPPSANVNGKYRRNGKLQSCEPCRKSKLRCDHVVPVCGRCVRRRCADACVYHPHPLTQIRPRRPRTSIPTPSTSTGHESPAAIRDSIETSIVQDVPHSAVDALPVPVNGAPRRPHRAASAPAPNTQQEPVPQGSPGFLGVTSYSSIFAENLGNLGVASGDDLNAPRLRNVTVSYDRIVQGRQVLSFFKDGPMINRFLSRWYEINAGSGILWPEPMMKEWQWHLWIDHGDVLKEQAPEKLTRLSELIWRNTQTPLQFNGKTKPLQWARLSTGNNLRWETIGIIAAIVGYTAITLDASDPLLQEYKVARQTLARHMSEVTEACVAFCQVSDALDDLYLWLIYGDAALTGGLKGDASYACYSRAGALRDAVVAMGWHQKIETNSQVPFFLTELRKRLTVDAYSYDVGLASFLGRPPRLSYRYCNLPVLLDLTDSQLLTEDDNELAASLATLNEAGYKTDGVMSQATFSKAWLGLAMRREDIMDLALADYSREEVLQRAEVIHHKIDEQWERLPPFIKKLRTYVVDNQKKKPLLLLLESALRRGSAANELLLQRVLIRKTGASPERLIQIARCMFKEALEFTQRHDMAAIFQIDMTSLLAIHGLRSAAIIAVELLKQEQLPTYPENPLLPRSETIQDLAVFAARLKAMDPTAGTFTICDQGRKVITRILDKILSPTKPVARPAASHQLDQDDLANGDPRSNISFMPGVTPTTPGSMDLGFDAPFFGPDNDFMHWLESTNWEDPDPWTGLGTINPMV